MPRKTRRRPWGSITEITRGKKYVIRWTENTDMGRRRKTKTVYGTHADADKELTRIRFTIINDSPTMTVGEVISKWYMPWLSNRLEIGKIKQSTYDSYSNVLRRSILPRWKDVPIDSISPIAIQKWLDGLAKNEASIAIVIMKAAIDFPVKYELIESNKFRIGYDMPTNTKNLKSKKVYSLETANEVFEKARGTDIEAAVIISLFGSARVGESLGVKGSEVQLVERNGVKVAVVPIVRRVGIYNGEVMPDGDLKTKSSVRSIVIPAPYGARLYDIARENIGHEWLTRIPDGRAMGCWMLRYRWKELASDNYIPFSNLRSSWRTFAQFEWKIDYDTCELLMGHQLSGVSGRHYIKPSDDQLIDTVTKAMRNLG